MPTTLPLTSIRTDGGTQSRTRIVEEVVADYAAAYKARTPMPPPTVYYDGKDYWLADGFHRYRAAERAGLLTLRCDVKHGTKKEAAWHSVGANRTHGLRRTNEDKQNAVKMALQLHPERSNRAIAEHVGVEHHLVASVRGQLGDSPSSTRIGLDGKSRPATRAAPSGATASDFRGSEIPPPPPPEPEEGDAPAGEAPDGPPPPEPPAAELGDSAPADERGTEIPEVRRALWARRDEAQEMLTALSRIRGALKRAQDEDDELFRPVNFSSAIASVGQARAAVEVALRKYVCPMCQGEGCQLCKDTGLIGQFSWDNFVPPEFKT